MTMTRRQLTAMLGCSAALWPLATSAQRLAKVRRVGFLSQSARTLSEPFEAGLRERGWIAGRNVTIDWRLAAGDLSQLAPFAANLVETKVDVIVAAATPAAKAAQKATRNIPIVAIDPGDPVQLGLVASLARPGGNITAESSIAPDLQAKRLQLLKEVAPRISRVAVLSNAVIPPAEVALQELRSAAESLKVGVDSIAVSGPKDFEAAFAAIVRNRDDALLVFHDPLTLGNVRSIVAFANQNRMPAMYGSRDFVTAGGLMSYGPSYPEMFQRAGVYVGRILAGEKPSDLPVEQPTRFEFVVNGQAAKVLGVALPPMLIAVVDEVID